MTMGRTILVAGISTMLFLCGCSATTESQSGSRPIAGPQPAVTVATTPSVPRYAAPPKLIVTEAIAPEANDVYISAATNCDVVFLGGSTYVWATGPDGRRHRHFYGHGDRRQEVFHRRENLRSIVVHHPALSRQRYARQGFGRQHADGYHAQHQRARNRAGCDHQLKNSFVVNGQAHYGGSKYEVGHKPEQAMRDVAVARKSPRPAPSV